LGILYLSQSKKQIATPFIAVVNPYQFYINTLTSPSPTAEIKSVVAKIALLYTIPGWAPTIAEYVEGNLRVNEKSAGTKINVLYKWAADNGAKIQMASEGVYLLFPIS